MEFRHLGRSGLLVSEISYGNWITHGSQVEEEQATACVHAALDHGITTFDTADVYAGTRAEAVLGRALDGQRRDGLEIFTKVYWPTGPGRNDRGLSRKHLMESNRMVLEDKVWRSLGVLRYARKLTSEEAMELLSAVRLGVVLGILNAPALPSVNELFVLIQPAHVQKLAGKELEADERDQRRATLLRERFG